MAGEFMVGVLLCLTLLREIVYFYQQKTLLDRLMARDYHEYMNGELEKLSLKNHVKLEAPAERHVDL